MFDFRLKVFFTVAKRLSFTKAAEELCITQPAVTKHIKEVERHYRRQMFRRSGNGVRLTEAGEILLAQVEKLFEIYHHIDLALSTQQPELRGALRIGASTTAAQYVLPGLFALFKKKYPGITATLVTGNTEQVEHLLVENKIDLGMVEGRSKRSRIKYSAFLKDEIVLCTGAKNKNVPALLKPVELKKLPFVLREQGSGSLEVITAELKKAKLKLSDLNVEMILEGSESIKSYLLHSDAFAFLSVHAILNELQSNRLKIIDVEKLSMDRYFYFIVQQGDNNPLKELFIKTAAAGIKR